nr:hypothetical protein CFP56_12909 [Quercus suber]
MRSVCCRPSSRKDQKTNLRCVSSRCGVSCSKGGQAGQASSEERKHLGFESRENELRLVGKVQRREQAMAPMNQ